MVSCSTLELTISPCKDFVFSPLGVVEGNVFNDFRRLCVDPVLELASMPFSVLPRVVLTESSVAICVPPPTFFCVKRKHRIYTYSAAMSLDTRPLLRPSYLQGVTFENCGDYATKCALTTFKIGRLSAAPCDSVRIAWTWNSRSLS